MGVPIQKENEAPLDAEAKGGGGEWERSIPPHQLLGLGEHREFSERGPERSPGRKWFYCNLISADRFC